MRVFVLALVLTICVAFSCAQDADDLGVGLSSGPGGVFGIISSIYPKYVGNVFKQLGVFGDVLYYLLFPVFFILYVVTYGLKLLMGKIGFDIDF